MSAEQIRKQIEYYLGDANLARDDFFRQQISDNKDGYVKLSLFLNCNKIKSLDTNVEAIAEALAGSEELEMKEDKSAVRRVGNKALPEKTGTLKKREQKAVEKDEKKNGVEEEVPIRDEQGRVIFLTQDFENPIIVHFKTNDQDEAKDGEYKVNWKDLENMVKDKFDRLKVVYSRADKYEGDLAISSYKVNLEQLEKLVTLKDEVIGDKKFSFSKTGGEDLKDFWQRQGGHYNFCTAPKVRLAKKQNKVILEKKRDENLKRQKRAYTIAGVYYMDINKVKSKSRAILNTVKDGEKLEEEDAAFIKELLRFHDKSEKKLASLSHFLVDFHPEYNKTRCFFAVKEDGSKEDFSITKCITNLENKSNEE
jgi:hypothetical protein